MAMTEYNLTTYQRDSVGTEVVSGRYILSGVVSHKSQKGLLLPNPHSYTKLFSGPGTYVTRSVVGSSCKAVSSTYSSPANGSRLYNTFLSGDSQIATSRLEDEALMRLYEKIRGSSNLIVDAAEGRQTLAMVRKALSFKRLVKEFMNEVIGSKRYKRIRGKNRDARRLDYITSKWLEYRYGWQPLIYSIWDLVENLHRHRDGGYILVKGRRGGEFNRCELTGRGTNAMPYRELKIDYSKRCEIGILFNFPPGNNISDFTRLNPLSIAWELTTLSFVADWFLNIGQQLELWENYVLYSSNFRSGYKTITELERRTLYEVGSTSSPSQYSSNGLCLLSFTYYEGRYSTGTTKATRLARTRLLGLPRPAGVRVKANMNAKRFLDAAALIRAQFSRR